MSRAVGAILTRLAASHRPLPLSSLAEVCGGDRRTAGKTAAALVREGLLARCRPGWYALTDRGRVAAAAARPQRSFAHCTPARVWRALRKVRKATVPELVALCDAEAHTRGAPTVRNYLADLQRAGYVKRLAGRQGARGGRLGAGFSSYLLVRDTGPEHPRWRHGRAAMLDGNTGEVHAIRNAPPAGARGPADA